MTRTRSEYLLESLEDLPAPTRLAARPPLDDDRAQLASLLLAAYRGTIDDEGEDEAEAVAAIDHYFGSIDHGWSRVVESEHRLIAMCFILDLGSVFYIDPIAVAPSDKSRGLGSELVIAVLNVVRDGGVTQVRAVITDGNIPSERLFSRLGFKRLGTWG